MRKATVLRKCMILIVTLVMISTQFSIAFAHELFYSINSYTGRLNTVELTWYPKITRLLDVSIYDQNLPTTLSNCIEKSMSGWNNQCGEYLYMSKTTSSSAANTFLIEPTSTIWNRVTGGGATADADGFTVPYDTDGTAITSYSEAYYSTKSIRSAMIYFNPGNEWSEMSVDTKRLVIAHELGHALCLGHCDDELYNPTTENSIMKFSSYCNTYIPRSHDVNDISAKYGSD